jgi:hypothetical protein
LPAGGQPSQKSRQMQNSPEALSLFLPAAMRLESAALAIAVGVMANRFVKTALALTFAEHASERLSAVRWRS